MTPDQLNAIQRRRYDSLPESEKPRYLAHIAQFNAAQSQQRQQQPKAREKTGNFLSTALGALQGATAGFADEYMGGRGAGGGNPMGVPTFGGAGQQAATAPQLDYGQARDIARGQFREARQDNPIAYAAGELGAGLAGGAAAARTAGKGALTLENAIRSNTGAGMLYGAGHGEGVEGKTKQAAIEGLVGGALGGAIGGIARRRGVASKAGQEVRKAIGTEPTIPRRNRPKVAQKVTANVIEDLQAGHPDYTPMDALAGSAASRAPGKLLDRINPDTAEGVLDFVAQRRARAAERQTSTILEPLLGPRRNPDVEAAQVKQAAGEIYENALGINNWLSPDAVRVGPQHGKELNRLVDLTRAAKKGNVLEAANTKYRVQQAEAGIPGGRRRVLFPKKGEGNPLTRMYDQSDATAALQGGPLTGRAGQVDPAILNMNYLRQPGLDKKAPVPVRAIQDIKTAMQTAAEDAATKSDQDSYAAVKRAAQALLHKAAPATQQSDELFRDASRMETAFSKGTDLLTTAKRKPEGILRDFLAIGTSKTEQNAQRAAIRSLGGIKPALTKLQDGAVDEEMLANLVPRPQALADARAGVLQALQSNPDNLLDKLGKKKTQEVLRYIAPQRNMDQVMDSIRREQNMAKFDKGVQNMLKPPVGLQPGDIRQQTAQAAGYGMADLWQLAASSSVRGAAAVGRKLGLGKQRKTTPYILENMARPGGDFESLARLNPRVPAAVRPLIGLQAYEE